MPEAMQLTDQKQCSFPTYFSLYLLPLILLSLYFQFLSLLLLSPLQCYSVV